MVATEFILWRLGWARIRFIGIDRFRRRLKGSMNMGLGRMQTLLKTFPSLFVQRQRVALDLPALADLSGADVALPNQIANLA